MLKPYLNYRQRFNIRIKTLSGQIDLLKLKWLILLRNALCLGRRQIQYFNVEVKWEYQGNRYASVERTHSLQAARRHFQEWCAGEVLSVKRTKLPVGHYRAL